MKENKMKENKMKEKPQMLDVTTTSSLIDYTNPIQILENVQKDSQSLHIVNMFEDDMFDSIKKIRDDKNVFFCRELFNEMFCDYFRKYNFKIRSYIESDKCPVCLDTDIKEDENESCVCYDLNEFIDRFVCNTCESEFNIIRKCNEREYEYYDDDTEEFETIQL